jgi:translation initiation factor IF-3
MWIWSRSRHGNPPVCRLMDYGKFKYQEQKKAAEAKAKQTVIEIKEVKFRPGTDDGDYNIKMRNMRRFWRMATSARSRCASAAARSRTRTSAWLAEPHSRRTGRCHRWSSSFPSWKAAR